MAPSPSAAGGQVGPQIATATGRAVALLARRRRTGLLGAGEREVGQEGDEVRIGADRRCTQHPDADRLRPLARLGVEVIDDLQVIADEADGSDGDGADAVRGEGLEAIADVRLEPGLGRGPRAGAEGQVVRDRGAEADVDGTGESVGHGQEGARVGMPAIAGWPGCRVHGIRDGMSDREDVVDRTGLRDGVAEQAGEDARVGRVVGIRRELVEDDLEAGGGAGEVFAVLPAGGIGPPGAGEDDKDPARRKSGDHLADEGRGVAVGEVDRDRGAAAVELAGERGDERAVLGVDRADSAEEGVVRAHLGQSLVRYAAPGRHPAQEREDLIGALGAAEGEHHAGVIGREGVGGHGTTLPACGVVATRAGGRRGRVGDDTIRTPRHRRLAREFHDTMQDLRFIGVHEDGGHVLLADAAGARYRLPLDERLRSALRRRPQAPSAEPERPHLSARDVQGLLRSGVSTAEVAERAGWSLAKVTVFEAPVLAERGHVVGLAMNARLPDRSGTGEVELLSARVERRLAGRGVAPEQTEWDATRSAGGDWEVHVAFPAGGRERHASWRFEHTSSVLEAMDDEARWLSVDDGAGGQVPTPPRLGEVVYDVDAAGGVHEADVDAEPVRSDRTDALMTAIREHSHAGGRRGPRRRTRGSASRGAGVAEGTTEAGPGSAPEADPGLAEAGRGGRVSGRRADGIPELPLEDLPTPTVDLPPSASIPPPARGVHPLDREVEARAEDEPTPDVEPQLAAEAPEERESVAETETADPTQATAVAETVEVAGATESAEPVDPGEAAEPDAADAEPAPPPGGRRRGRVGVPDWNDVMFGPSRTD